ncbi:MAG: DsrE family protein, partial [Candidatus Odinarchaeia archaeon]
MHPVELTLKSLKDLEIPFYVIKESMEKRGITEDTIEDYAEPEIIPLSKLPDLQQEFDTTIFF